MIKYMHQINLIEPRRMLEKTFVAQALKQVNFSHLIFFVELAHSEKLPHPGVCTLEPNIVQVYERPGQVGVRSSEKNIETLFCGPVVIPNDNDEAQGAGWGEGSHEKG